MLEKRQEALSVEDIGKIFSEEESRDELIRLVSWRYGVSYDLAAHAVDAVASVILLGLYGSSDGADARLKFLDRARLMSYFFRGVRWYLLDQFKKIKPVSLEEAVAEARCAADTGDPACDSLHNEAVQLFLECCDSVLDPTEQVIVRQTADARTLEEMAAGLGISVSTAHRRRERARRKVVGEVATRMGVCEEALWRTSRKVGFISAYKSMKG